MSFPEDETPSFVTIFEKHAEEVGDSAPAVIEGSRLDTIHESTTVGEQWVRMIAGYSSMALTG